MYPYARRRRRRRILLILMFLCVIFVGYQIIYGGDQENPLEQSQPEIEDFQDLVSEEVIAPIEPLYHIVIDPGHGGKDGGAIGASGKLEKDFTLELSMKIYHLLADIDEVQVDMTRNDDTFISSIDRERAEFANQLGADVLISIHGNTYTDASVSGTETYYYDDSSLLFANIMQRHVVRASGFRDRGVKQEDYFVIRETAMPAVLIEVGFLTNPEEEEQMWDPKVQDNIAQAIINGIKEYLNVEDDSSTGDENNHLDEHMNLTD